MSSRKPPRPMLAQKVRSNWNFNTCTVFIYVVLCLLYHRSMKASDYILLVGCLLGFLITYVHISCFKQLVGVYNFFFLCLLFAAEITLLESNIVVYKFAQDLHFFVTGGENENELVLSSVLQGFFDAVALLLRYLTHLNKWLCAFLDQWYTKLKLNILSPYRNNVEKMEALENLDLIFLCLDEMVDQGYATYAFKYYSTIFLLC